MHQNKDAPMNAIAKIQHPSHTENLEQQITQLASNINAANYKLLTLIAEFDSNRGWAKWGSKSCAHWLNWKCGIALGAAREKVRVANALIALPKVADAFASGQLSYSKARAITRIASSENEDSLLMIAEHGSASHIEKTVRGFRRVSREKAQSAQDARELKYYWGDDGLLHVKATLSAEQGALFLKALELASHSLEDDEWKTQQEETENDKYVSAETLPESVAHLAPEKRGRRAQLRADALVMMAESQLEQSGTACKTADRYQVLIHADVSKALPRYALEDGPSLAEETVKRVCCDASVSHVVSRDSEPVSIGRKSRTIPPPMRRALQLRDGGCRFPGCCSTRFVDGHHIQHWSAGGETSLKNLVLLCRHHHRLVHEGGYSVVRSSAGELLFHRPDGVPLREVPLSPDAQTLPFVPLSKWYWKGDRMDYGIAVESLVIKREKALRVSAETHLIGQG